MVRYNEDDLSIHDEWVFNARISTARKSSGHANSAKRKTKNIRLLQDRKVWLATTEDAILFSVRINNLRTRIAVRCALATPTPFRIDSNVAYCGFHPSSLPILHGTRDETGESPAPSAIQSQQ